MAARLPPGARRAPLPERLLPQLATPSASAPSEGDWLYEMKFDGYRLLARSSKSGVTLHTRSGADWTAKLPDLARAIGKLRLGDAWLDGEIVVLGPTGVPSFQRLQNAFDARHTATIRYYVFDLPFHGGLDLREVRQEERRERLSELVPRGGDGPVLFSEAFDEPVESLFATACKVGLEGLIAKRADAPYVSTRSRAWLKLKCTARQEFVIGGFTQPQGSRTGFGALLLGVHDGGKLRYAGRVGTGFDDRGLEQMHRQLLALRSEGPHFANPPRGADARGVTWVRPELVGEVEFAEWTEEGIVRHAAFRGLRKDKPARTIKRERPQAPPGNPKPAGYLQEMAEAMRPWEKRLAPGKPDRVAFSLIPGPGVSWARVQEAAELTRALLAELGLEGFVKTDGLSGLDLVVPLTKASWEDIEAFAQTAARHLAFTLPERITATPSARARAGRVFLDSRPSHPDGPLTLPYAQATDGSGISMPVSWESLVEVTDATAFTTANAAARWREGGDPWGGYSKARRALAPALRRLREVQSPAKPGLRRPSKRTMTATPRATRSRA